MLNKINQWVDQTNGQFRHQRQSCVKFADQFSGFYSRSFLERVYFVVLDRLPKPDFPELRKLGLGDFIDMEANGITYKNTYYLTPQAEQSVRVHFHELVHVAQWQFLGAEPFIKRYMNEILSFGYDKAPLEKMAYALDAHFSAKGESVDVPMYVARVLGNA